MQVSGANIPAKDLIVTFEGSRDFDFTLCSKPECKNRKPYSGKGGRPKYCSVTSNDNVCVRMPENGELLLSHLTLGGRKVLASDPDSLLHVVTKGFQGEKVLMAKLSSASQPSKPLLDAHLVLEHKKRENPTTKRKREQERSALSVRIGELVYKGISPRTGVVGQENDVDVHVWGCRLAQKLKLICSLPGETQLVIRLIPLSLLMLIFPGSSSVDQWQRSFHHNPSTAA